MIDSGERQHWTGPSCREQQLHKTSQQLGSQARNTQHVLRTCRSAAAVCTTAW